MEKERMKKQEHASKLASLMTFIDIQFMIVYPLAYVFAYYQTMRPYFRKYHYHYRLCYLPPIWKNYIVIKNSTNNSIMYIKTYFS